MESETESLQSVDAVAMTRTSRGPFWKCEVHLRVCKVLSKTTTALWKHVTLDLRRTSNSFAIARHWLDFDQSLSLNWDSIFLSIYQKIESSILM